MACAYPPLALVCWEGDPKPDCWQVIKTSEIRGAKPEDIKEGKSYDAVWDKDEETGVATILKLGDNKAYLNSVREKEYARPLREAARSERRVPIPKKLGDGFVPEELPESTENLPSDSPRAKVTKKRKERNPTVQTKPPPVKKQKKDKGPIKAKSRKTNDDDEDDDENVPSRTIVASKAAAEQVLAKKILERNRSGTCSSMDPTVPATVTEHNNNEDLKGHQSDDGDGGVTVTTKKTAKSISKSKELFQSKCINDQVCCKSCTEKFEQITESLSLLEEEVGLLKRRIRKLKKSSADRETDDCQSAGLEKECRELIKNSTSLFNTVSILMRRLFTTEEIIIHSVSGKAGNSKLAPKPKFDSERLELLKSLCIEMHNEATVTVITSKIQAVQKAVRKSSPQGALNTP